MPDVQSVRTGLIADAAVLAEAAHCLARGECIVVPTDTVYGLAARADDAAAVARLQDIKGRADAFPPPVLVADPADAWALARPASPAAHRLADAFWPGALTLVLATDRTDLSLAYLNGTIGLRVPDLPALRPLLRLTGPLAVSSANRHTAPAATTVAEAAAQLGDAVALYIDGGPTPGPAPSTVVDCATGAVLIRREGLLSRAQILDAAGVADA